MDRRTVLLLCVWRGPPGPGGVTFFGVHAAGRRPAERDSGLAHVVRGTPIAAAVVHARARSGSGTRGACGVYVAVHSGAHGMPLAVLPRDLREFELDAVAAREGDDARSLQHGSGEHNQDFG